MSKKEIQLKELNPSNLARLHLWWFSIKYVHWLDAIFYHTNGTIKHSHQVTKMKQEIINRTLII